MNKRPIAVTGVSWLMIAAGVLGLAHGFSETKTLRPFQYDLIWIALFGVAGIVCGIFMLRGNNWARWLTLVWLACHVAISFFNALQGVVVHAVIFALITYLLIFRSDVRAYFGGGAPVDEVG